jgi:ribose 5-phosphate isomerase B
MKKILISSDHAGFELKKVLAPFIRELGFEVKDMGAFEFDAEDDYPDFVMPLAEEISAASEHNSDLKGIVIGGSGQGEAISANRFKGVRAVVFNGQYRPDDGRYIPHEIVTSREHNDANILSLGARFLSVEDAKNAVEVWLSTSFSGDERHVRRIKKIDEYNK